MPDADPPGPRDRTRLATLSLHISAVLWAVLAGLLAAMPFGADPPTLGGIAIGNGTAYLLAALALALAILSRLVIRGLRDDRRWAFKTGIVLFVLYLPSWFLPLGVVGLLGLLSKGSRMRFEAPGIDP